MESETKDSSQSAAMTCSAEEWWAKHSALLAQKMAVGGVRSFRLDHLGGKRFIFEVVPMSEPPSMAASHIIRRLLKYADKASISAPKTVTGASQQARADAGLWLARFDRQNA